MRYLICIWYICFIILPGSCFAFSDAYGKKIYDPGKLKPTDSRLKVKTGDVVPDFTLTAVSGKKISLKQFRGKKNVLISFIPAAWTPVCSDQWPGYNIAKPFFDRISGPMAGLLICSEFSEQTAPLNGHCFSSIGRELSDS